VKAQGQHHWTQTKGIIMGYRSDWRIAFNTHHKAKHVKDMLGDFVTNNPSHYVSPLLEEMLQLAISHEDDSLFVLEETGWKLVYWDELVSVLHDMFDDDPEVDFASIRLGEDCDDNEINHGNHTYVYMCRDMSDTDFDPVPAVLVVKQRAPGKKVCDCPMSIHGILHTDDCQDKK